MKSPELRCRVSFQVFARCKCVTSTMLASVVCSAIFIANAGWAGNPPVVINQPQQQVVVSGGSATFSVTADGDAPLDYRWRTSQSFIPGATNGPAVTLTNVVTSTFVWVIISNGFGMVTSAPASLTVTSAPVVPSFTTQPTNIVIAYGGNGSLFASASGTPPLTYRWFRNGVLLPSTNSPSYVIFNASSNDAGPYFCVASNSSGTATSDVATVYVTTTPPLITQHPTNITVAYGGTATFRVTAAGSSPLFYQWTRNGTAVGSNSSTLSIFNAGPATSGTYVCTVTNLFGSAVSQPASLTIVSNPPVFTLHPTNTSAPYLGSTTLRVTASGSPAPVFRWYHDGAPVGSNTANLFLSSLTSADAGAYFCVASNVAGMATSQVATLTIYSNLPAFTLQPVSQTVDYYYSAQFTANATGVPTPALSWYHNGFVVGYGDVLSIFSATDNESGSYYCVASNVSGMATSAVATLTVRLVPPVVQVYSTNVTAYAGQFITLYAYGSGAPWPTLQWFRLTDVGWTNISPPPYFTNSSVVYFPNISTNDAGSYVCVASNIGGMTTSAVVTVTVIAVPPILSGPDDMELAAGQSAYIRVGVSNPPAQLDLYFEGTNLVLSSSFYSYYSTYLYLGDLQETNSGHYTVVASNEFGFSTSRVATITVTSTPPSVYLWGPTSNLVEGTPVYFYGSAWGSAPISLSLWHDGVLVPPDASGPGNWHIAAVTLQDAGDYTLVASNHAGVATSVIHLSVRPAGILDRWFVRNPSPQGRDLHGVAWGNNLFVAIGDNGAIITSTNGTNWTARNAYTAANFTSISFGNGQFVVTADNGFAFFSTNGEVWDSAVIQSNFVTSVNIAFGNGRFLAVGGDRYFANGGDKPWPDFKAYQSSNGVSWSPVDLGSSMPVGAVVGYGTNFVVAQSGAIANSPDLASWTYGASWFVPTPTRIRWLDNRYVAIGNATISESTNGLDWSLAITNSVGGKLPQFWGVARGAGQYVIVMTKGRIITSTGDFRAWNSVSSPTSDRLEDVVFANNLFVAVGENGTVLTSTTGLNWTNQTSGANSDLDGLAVGNGLAIAVGKNGTILTSTNGAQWSYIRSPEGLGLHGIAYGDGKWVAVGQSSNVLVSTDGRGWTIRPTGIDSVHELKGVLYASNQWIVVGVEGQILTSPDTVTWTMRASPVAFDLNEVAYGNGLYVIIGDHGGDPNATLLTSLDGITWTDRTYYSGKNGRCITFANGMFAMGNNDGLIYYTDDPLRAFDVGPYWTSAYTPVATSGGWNVRGITASNGMWVAVGNNGLILTGTNYNWWEQRSAPTYENLHAVRYFNDSFVAIGNEGIILQTAAVTPKLVAQKNGATMRFTLRSPVQGVFKLQHTEDFVTWSDVSWLTNAAISAECLVPLPSGPTKGFYRVTAP